MSEEKNVEVGGGGLKCDYCDYKDDSVSIEELGKHINRKCPTCGENLLTLEDWMNAQKLLAAADFINSLTPEQMAMLPKDPTADPNKRVKVTYNTHKTISVDKIEPIDEELS